MMGYGDMGPWGWWMVVVGSLVWFSFLAAIGLGLWAALRPSTERAEHSPRPTPLDVLKTRYARGEIARQEFEQTKRDLA